MRMIQQKKKKNWLLKKKLSCTLHCGSFRKMVEKAVERERGIGLEGAILYCVPFLHARACAAPRLCRRAYDKWTQFGP